MGSTYDGQPAPPRATLSAPVRLGVTHLSLLRKTFVLGLGAGGARILGAGILILLARVLGVTDFGKFGFAMSVALLLEVVIDMGQSTHIGRLVAHDPDSGPDGFGDLALNKLALTALAAVLVGVAVHIGKADAAETLTVVLMVVWGGSLSILDSERSVARSLGLFGADSVVNSGESVGRLLGVAGVWALGLGLAGYGAAFALECTVAAVAFFFYLSRKVTLAPRRIDAASAARFFRASTPLGLSGMAFVGFYQIDQVFVRTMAGAEANGLYGAATRIVFAATTIASLVLMAAFPDMARDRDHPDLFRSRFGGALGLAFGIALAVTAVAFFGAAPLVGFLYGAPYERAVPLLRVLAPVIAMNAVVISAVGAANALGRERRALVGIAILFGANVVANLLLVPRFGAYASAWISTVGEIVMALAMLAVSWDRIVLTSPLRGAADARS